MSDSILHANLDCLRVRNSSLARRIEETQPACNVELRRGADGLITGTYQGVALASSQRPQAEAQRFANEVDVTGHAAVAVLGFGLGHHVAAIAQRMRKTGIVLVFEPDVALLRRVFQEVDHSAWMRNSLTVFFEDGSDRPALSARLEGASAILVQGLHIAVHGPSAARLGRAAQDFQEILTQHVAATRTTMVTTLVQSPTSCRNVALNLDHYASGGSINSLKDWAKGHPAMLVAAGPSLSRNVALLCDQRIRERAVIIAAQTALKPLLRRGVRPHFVTALDYHEISRQFYDGLTAQDVAGTALVIDPKVNRAVTDAYPGDILVTGNHFAEQILGDSGRKIMKLPAAASVGHMSFYLAQHLGCDPIVLVGQDLGFTDGVYYGTGAAIHEQWAPEVNAFNTVEMMEWQRIARMKRTLRDTRGQNGRKVLVDEQMATYLQQFERDFAKAGERIIDATGGGTAKQHTEVMNLQECIHRFVLPAPILPTSDPRVRLGDLTRAKARIQTVRHHAHQLADLSRTTKSLIERMLESQDDPQEMERLHQRVDSARAEVGRMLDILDQINHINQLGLFNRLKLDRALELATDLTPKARQRKQLERDLENVKWLAEAADEYGRMLEESLAVMDGARVDGRISERIGEQWALEVLGTGRVARNDRPIAACLWWVEESQSGDLVEGRSVLSHVVERIDETPGIDAIIVCTGKGQRSRVERALGTRYFHHRIIVHEGEGNGAVIRDAVRVARRWSRHCWRGGIGGMSIYDEVIHARVMKEALDAAGCAAGLIIGADWILVDPSVETGCGAVVKRFREMPDSQRLAFSQAPPGLSGCVVSTALLGEMSLGLRRGTLGAILSYMPHLPQLDPITKEMCVKLPAALRGSLGRFTFDTRGQRLHIRRMMELGAWNRWTCPDTIAAAQRLATNQTADPEFVEFELATRADGPLCCASDRVIDEILDHPALRAGGTLTLGVRGDALDHPMWTEVVARARRGGVEAIHVRTQLTCVRQEQVDALLASGADVISVHLDADCEETSRKVWPNRDWHGVIRNMERLLRAREVRVGVQQLGLPWIVPTLHKQADNVDDLMSFYDRWLFHAGAVAIRSAREIGITSDGVLEVETPAAAAQYAADRQLVFDWDGSVLGSPNSKAVAA